MLLFERYIYIPCHWSLWNIDHLLEKKRREIVIILAHLNEEILIGQRPFKSFEKLSISMENEKNVYINGKCVCIKLEAFH